MGRTAKHEASRCLRGYHSMLHARHRPTRLQRFFSRPAPAAPLTMLAMCAIHTQSCGAQEQGARGVQPDRSGAADELSATSADPVQMPLKCTSMGKTCGSARMRAQMRTSGVPQRPTQNTSFQPVGKLLNSLVGVGTSLAPWLVPNRTPDPCHALQRTLLGFSSSLGGRGGLEAKRYRRRGNRLSNHQLVSLRGGSTGNWRGAEGT